MAGRRFLWLRAAAIGVAAAALVVSSCGPKRPSLYRVEGKVFFEGQPAAGAVVTFHPIVRDDESVPLSSGVVQSDGTFKLATYETGDGAPPGRYDVSILWIDENATADETGELANKLPARYGYPKTSQLTATVDTKSTTLPPFQLTK